MAKDKTWIKKMEDFFWSFSNVVDVKFEEGKDLITVKILNDDVSGIPLEYDGVKVEIIINQ